MKRQKPRDLALLALNRDEMGHWKQDRYLDQLWEARPPADQRDRAFALNLVQGVRRWKLKLDYIISSFLRFPFKDIEPQIVNILRIALYQIFYMDRVPDSAAVNEAVGQVETVSRQRHLKGFVNGILRKICREKDSISFPDSGGDFVSFLSVYYSYPEWLVRRWIRELGEDVTEGLLMAQNSIPKTTLRANSRRCRREELAVMMEKEDIKASETRYSPAGLLLESLPRSLTSLNSFSKGLFQVQSEPAQICSYLLDPRPGERVLDLCAGLGGKSTHLAELMGDRGSIVSLDISMERLHLLNENAERLGLESLSAVMADACSPGVFNCLFDKILLDGPCSGLGIIHRHPEIKWNRLESDLPQFAKLQKKMLDACVPLLREEGRILYVACTISREENEKVIERFLAAHQGMDIISLAGEAPEWARDLVDREGFFRTYPHLHSMDGFFGALMTKRRN